ncbi:DUF1573 domain-containing protein [Gelidibacter salicanalis]|uniref:DUF1573 domain-containing protein n=1 Tax=Gelidibacter salicanalis TaxID=291193 RepID=A0A934KKQ1_9FLAO|nr:DUF1573 domain-containing protein [Gelidibacter salicanalis]MBJ7881226.1 DUF1573 domain-containing protein [Gelidibacter salicanalis]
MKKIMLGVSALCLVAFTSCKEDATAKIKSENVAEAAARDANSGNFATIEFEETEHDFGTIQNGTPVETVFRYTNTGTSPLVVSDIKSTCGCTVPSDWTKQVAPGETGEFNVKFDGKGNGLVTKAITMTTNTEKGAETVRIKAMVEGGANAMQPAAQSGAQSIMQQPVRKSSTQPGHEGHNHD